MWLESYIHLFLVWITVFIDVHAGIPSCKSDIYCRGDLLKTVQMARIFPDSKTFVDMKMQYRPKEVLKNFKDLMHETKHNASRQQIKQFVKDNFQPGNELENWKPSDFNPNPPFLYTVTVPQYREFARDLVQLWPKFSRKLKPDVFIEPDRYSIIPVTNGFVVPGGRFREFYYWDSYWIMKGLLASGMHDTVRGMIENFLQMVDKYGFVPNGGRVYYLNRSQPPLLSLMVLEYLEATNDLPWLRRNIHLLQRELEYWLKTQTTTFRYQGFIHTLAHYAVDSPSPRPESYREDVNTCSPRKDKKDIKNCYKDLKSGAETGWDFSSRWIFTKNGSYGGNLSDIETRRVLPVDLNAILAQAFNIFSSFARSVGYIEESNYWQRKSEIWTRSIQEVFYNKTDGIWYDMDLKLKKHRTGFYPSNLAPLWCNLAPSRMYGDLAVRYLERVGILNNFGISKFPGGTPTSLLSTGEQWDLPNAWPPLQSIVILGLKRSGSTAAMTVAKQLAESWIDNNLLIYKRTGFMFEKYNAELVGVVGGGGEYSVQTGFGWTNGLIFELLEEFFSRDSYL
ncbi:hypothetical protein WA026_010929 [Henosepilachna vigintioctopunctata]|uniref:Trehalase n=1 Tax=Henosepilachna vigintioctopunctata TaxID=420089 RepID=A0AAW1UPK8_9CUCU